MRFDNLSQPVSETDPAGPDLDEEGDSAYLNYMLVAPDRLPTSYLVQAPGTQERRPFDRSSIELDKELDKIAELLERTRDIRLLTLDARFNAAAGKLIGFIEATQGLSIVVTTFWDTLHPRPADGDMIVRQNTVESLDDLGQIVLHLQNATIAGGGRTRPVSLRHYLLATGKAEAREDEEQVPLDQISATMTNEANAADVTALHAGLEASRTALDAVRATFMEKAGAEFAPSFDRLLDLYKQMREMIGAFRADLAPPKAEGAEEGTEGYADGSGSALALTGAVKTHADAAAALAAAESYFLRLEPSSPALILVHQSRLLIGQPLTFALEALMPEPSQRAALRFDSGFKFDIDLSRMKTVTDDALANGIPAEEPEQSSSGGDGWDSWNTSSSDQAAPSEESASSSSGWDDWGSSSSSEENPEASAEISEGSPADGSPSDGTSEGSSEGEISLETLIPDEPAHSSPASLPTPLPVPAGAATFKATTRGQASELIQATETFFRAAEPSSAIPLLLSKARTYISKDFASILSELMPREPTGE
jgi:type VI secretion system protein ImpA